VPAGSIVINATTGALNPGATGFYVQPIRNLPATGNSAPLWWNSATAEIFQGPSGSAGGGSTGPTGAPGVTPNIGLVLDGATYPYTYHGIQLAQNALPNGGTIIIPPNVTITGNPNDLTITTSNLTIAGASDGTSIVQCPAGPTGYTLFNVNQGGHITETTLAAPTVYGHTSITVASATSLSTGAYILINTTSTPFISEMTRISSVSGTTIGLISAVHFTYPSSTTNVDIFLNITKGIIIRDLTFLGTGNTGPTTQGVYTQFGTNFQLKDCQFIGFPNAAFAADTGFGNKWTDNFTTYCGSVNQGATTLARQNDWLMDGHSSDSDTFSIVLQQCFGGTVGKTRVRNSQVSPVPSGRAFKMLDSSGNNVDSLVCEGSADVNVLINGLCQYNNFGLINALGGTFGLDFAGSATTPGTGPQYNWITSAVCKQQTTWAVFMDNTTNNNVVSRIAYDGSFGNNGVGNVFTTTQIH
jgi:hypothetical protein